MQRTKAGTTGVGAPVTLSALSKAAAVRGARAALLLLVPTVIHRTQHWFHGRISREESHRIIKQQGLVDG